jgi:hypothetical protein
MASKAAGIPDGFKARKYLGVKLEAFKATLQVRASTGCLNAKGLHCRGTQAFKVFLPYDNG